MTEPAPLSMGIYVNSQHPVTDDAGLRLRELVDLVRLARELDFDSIWAGEHHLTPGYHFFPQLTLLSHLAAHSGDMTVGTNLVLLPLHRPVDLAEQVALIDQACGGRFILTVGQGYRPEEFEAFGVPFSERLPRMVEAIELLRQLWSEDELTHQSEWFPIGQHPAAPAGGLPRAARPGGPPIWIGATSDRAIRRGGRIGDAFMATPNGLNGEVKRQIDLFAEARHQAGLPPAADVGRMLEVSCHQDRAEAHRRAAPHLLEKYAAYASWGLTGDAGEAASAAGETSTDDEFAALAHDRFVIGDPDDVVAGLVHQHRQVGVTHLAMRIAWPGSPASDAIECLDLLGRDVLPRVRSELG